MASILKVEGISKTYQQPALKNIHFEVKAGESVALVGANGAGKSTLIKIILALLQPTAGSGTLFSHPLGAAAGRERVAYLPEKLSLWPELSAQELLRIFSALHGLAPDPAQKHSENLLHALGLKVRGSRRAGTYSKGMLQRAGIALALLRDPDLIILDEPMSGLDPRAQAKLRQILLHLKARGKSLIISSHSLEDIRLLCDRVLVLERGELVADGPVVQVLGSLQERYLSSEPWDEDPIGEWRDDL